MYKRLVFLIGSICLSYLGSISISYAAYLDCNTAVNINIPAHECQALQDLYKFTRGPSWTYNTNRNTDTDVATRYGVTLSGGHVTELSLIYNELSGTLPASLSALSQLELFYLDSNRLTGALSPLRSARRNIREFSVSTNDFPGRLPDARSAWTNITFFNVGHNQLHGVLPNSRSSWKNIEYFYAYTNQLRGTLPDARNSWTGIRLFLVPENQFNGTLPSSRSSRQNIEEFDVSINQLSGSIPPSRSSWSHIYYFNISYNNFIGTLDPTHNWSTLYYFYAQNNNLHGILPSSRSSWFPTSYQYSDFDLSNNFLTGTIPSSWHTTWPDKGFSYLRLNDNCLQTTGYSSGVLTWLNTNVIYIPQKNCTVTPPTILSPTSGQILTTGNVQINGTGTAGNTITVSLSGTTLTGTINGLGSRTLLFNNRNNGSYTISAFQTDSVSTYNSLTVTRNFSINTLSPIIINSIKTKSLINGL